MPFLASSRRPDRPRPLRRHRFPGPPGLASAALLAAVVVATVTAALAAAPAAAAAGGAAPGTGRPSDPAVAVLHDQLAAIAPVPAAFAVIDGPETMFGGVHGAGPDTPFVIGSVSKSFTALAVLVEAGRGTLDLEAPVIRYLPGFRLASPGGDRILVRHLLNHTAGLDNAGCNRDFAHPFETIAARVEDLRSVTLARPPGEQFAYCNVGYAVLARILEEVTGRPFPEVLQTDVLGPVGMSNTFTDERAAILAGLVPGRTTLLGVPVVRPEHGFASALPDGYLVSTVRDLARYARFQLGRGTTATGRRLVPEALMRRMQASTVQVPGGAGTELAGYGYGWFVGPVGGRTIVSHGGTTYRYQADIAILPDTGRAVISLVAGQWLSGAAATTPAVVAGLLEQRRRPDRRYGFSTAALWIAGVGLVATVFVSVRRTRRRNQEHRPPHVLGVGAVLALGVGAALLTVPAVLATGSIPAALRFGWLAAPDLLLLQLAWPSALFWISGRAAAQRRRLRSTGRTVR